MSISRGAKALAIFSAIFGLMTLVTCCWTFGSMIVYHQQFEQNLGNQTTIFYDYSKYQSSPYISAAWAKLDNMSKHFKTTMYICIWVANFFLLSQISVSFLIFFRMSTKVSSISKYFVGIHFVVFLALLCCLFIPMTEDRKSNLHHSIVTFNSYIVDEFEYLGIHGLKYIVQDVHAYYFVLGSNIIVIFICMIITCCLLRCETLQPYESV